MEIQASNKLVFPYTSLFEALKYKLQTSLEWSLNYNSTSNTKNYIGGSVWLTYFLNFMISDLIASEIHVSSNLKIKLLRLNWNFYSTFKKYTGGSVWLLIFYIKKKRKNSINHIHIFSYYRRPILKAYDLFRVNLFLFISGFCTKKSLSLSCSIKPYINNY